MASFVRADEIKSNSEGKIFVHCRAGKWTFMWFLRLLLFTRQTLIWKVSAVQLLLWLPTWSRPSELKWRRLTNTSSCAVARYRQTLITWRNCSHSKTKFFRIKTNVVQCLIQLVHYPLHLIHYPLAISTQQTKLRWPLEKKKSKN